MQWEGKIGPATVVGVIQLLLILFGGIVTVSQMQNGIDNSKLAVSELKNVVSSIQVSQAINAERVGKLETSIGFIASSVQRLEERKGK